MTKYDNIGFWSEVKLEIIQKYATSYSRIMHAQRKFKFLYVDAFAGAGRHLSRKSKDFVQGSPLNALNVQPPFSGYHFIDLDGEKTKELEQHVGDKAGVTIHHGNCNDILLKKVFPLCRHQDYGRALCLLDPYALSVEWKVLKAAGEMGSVEVFYNFMIMDANMNVFWRAPDKVPESQRIRMDAVWGDRSWRTAAYTKQPGLWEEMEEKADNETVAQAFRQRLSKVAGFKYVPEPMPMRNSKGAVVYYLFFASPNKTGAKIVEGIFNRYRKAGGR